MSTLFLRTLRDNPADAEVPSHKLLARAGYVRRVAPGIYSWLPLGYRVYRNVERVVREEMERIGAQEVNFPALIPRDVYEVSGRWDDYGNLLFRLKDRKQSDYLLGPTHEELFTLMVKGEYSSYKDFPVVLYQIQTKYRDEGRPRAGILRGREFVMKDSYSFDLDDAGLQRSYALHRDAYIRTFTRLGFDYRIVSAMSGAMGGSASEEFLAPTAFGEDTFVQCTGCDYAANTEAGRIAVPEPLDGSSFPALPVMKVLDTPQTPTIQTLVASVREQGLDVDASGTLKNVVLKTREPGGDWELLVVGVPGDRDVDLGRLTGQLEPTEVTQAEADDLAREPRLVKGYIGPQILRETGVRYLVDPLVVHGSAWVTGANETDRHAAYVVRGRDFEPDGEIGAVEIREGDQCARCGSPLTIARGIEIGHIFQLGRKFADAFELDALGPEAKPIRITMGCYGIGVSRAVAALAEQCHDGKGLVWPREVAPADVHIVATGKDNQLEVALQLGRDLEQRGARALVDDRAGVSPGVKFTDAELLGVPTIVVVGKRLAEGMVELRDRASGERVDVALNQLADRVIELLPLVEAGRVT